MARARRKIFGWRWTMPPMSKRPIEYQARSSGGRIISAALSKTLRRVLPYLLVAMLCYLGSYICLSAFGRFEPAVIGTNGVKWYVWAPAGLVKDFKHRWGLFYFYAPLYLADRNY